MTCRELADFLSGYLAGELAPGVRAAFEHHLTLCPACVNYLSAYRATAELNRRAFADADAEAATEAPEDLIRAILESQRR